MEIIEVLLLLGIVFLYVFLTLIPLLLWTVCQEAPRPGWQLIPIGLLWLVLALAPVAAIVTLIYCLNIIITHRARVKTKRREEVSREEA
jgi:uncharacterized membrane protein